MSPLNTPKSEMEKGALTSEDSRLLDEQLARVLMDHKEGKLSSKKEVATGLRYMFDVLDTRNMVQLRGWLEPDAFIKLSRI
jgi:hypothetical protein